MFQGHTWAQSTKLTLKLIFRLRSTLSRRVSPIWSIWAPVIAPKLLTIRKILPWPLKWTNLIMSCMAWFTISRKRRECWSSSFHSGGYWWECKGKWGVSVISEGKELKHACIWWWGRPEYCLCHNRVRIIIQISLQ